MRSQRVGDRVIESVNVERQTPVDRRREAARRRPPLVERRVSTHLDVAAEWELIARVRLREVHGREGVAAAVRLGAAPKPPAAPEPVPGVAGCFFVADVLGDAQCAALAALGDALGDVAAASTDEAFFRSGTHSRIFLEADGAMRAAIDATLAACPPRGDASWTTDAAEVPAPSTRLGMNAKCRFLRYADGDSIQPHVDPAWEACDLSRGVDAVVEGAKSWCTAKLPRPAGSPAAAGSVARERQDSAHQNSPRRP